MMRKLTLFGACNIVALLIPQIAQAQITLHEFEVSSDVDKSLPIGILPLLLGGAGISQIGIMALLGLVIFILARRGKKE